MRNPSYVNCKGEMPTTEWCGYLENNGYVICSFFLLGRADLGNIESSCLNVQMTCYERWLSMFDFLLTCLLVFSSMPNDVEKLSTLVSFLCTVCVMVW